MTDDTGTFGPAKTLGLQFIFYLAVGGLSACVDVGVFIVLMKFGPPVIVASVASFTLATITNYFLSYLFAFTRGRFSQHAEVIRFWLVSLVGLGLNTGVVWLVVAVMMGAPVVAKVAALPIVLIWNFVGRRLFVFHKELPPATVALVTRRSKTTRPR